MRASEARSVLVMYRPGDSPVADPRITEALALAERDPELGQWWAEQQGLDSEIAAQLNAVPVPDGLQRSLLAIPHRAVKGGLLRPAFALAACLTLLAIGGAAWFRNRPVEFAALRQHVLDQSWGTSPHLLRRSSDWNEVRSWLADQNFRGKIEVPAGLAGARLKGCSLVNWRGHSVPVLCLMEGHRHMHLYVMNETEVVDVPSGSAPMLADYGPMNTVSWTNADNAYVLTGFNTKSLLKKFRKSGRWLLTT